MSIVCRPTREQALLAAQALVATATADEHPRETKFVHASDSVSIRTTFELAADEWLTPTLWTGAVRTHGAPAMALVGSPREVAAALLEFGQAGVSHFILSGWPKLDEMERFGTMVLPLIRAGELAAQEPKREGSSDSDEPS